MVYAFESRTWPKSGGLATARRARPRSRARRRADAGARAGAAKPGVREQPELGRPQALAGREEAGRPRATSSPRGRMCLPGATAPRRCGPPPRRPRRSRSARSLSAPAGIGAPVAIRTASPRPTVASGRWPIMARPTIASSTGVAGVALATSVARTAKPSMPLEANSGRSTTARMSAATTHPYASVSGSSIGGSG